MTHQECDQLCRALHALQQKDQVHAMPPLDIPSLRADRLAAVVPSATYAGGSSADPAHTLFVYRSCALARARGGTLAFYVDDYRLDPLWRRPRHYTELFLHHGIAALIEPDFSLWTDDPLAVQVFNVYRTRALGRYWQDAGLPVIPSLGWSDERSFSFCFAGIPQEAPVVACECRTPGGNDEDRRAFLRGLAEGVRQVQPVHILVYGGYEHRFWLHDHLPPGPAYTMLPSWTHERHQIRRAEDRAQRERYQFRLFERGETLCSI